MSINESFMSKKSKSKGKRKKSKKNESSNMHSQMSYKKETVHSLESHERDFLNNIGLKDSSFDDGRVGDIEQRFKNKN
jgi:hypothetical protein